jgi:outer membrane protein TolC
VRKSSFIGLHAALAAALAADLPAARGETLEDAWNAAIAADARLAATVARTAGRDAALAAARAERLPSISAVANTSHWRDTPAFDFTGVGLPVQPLFGGDTLNVASAQVSLPLYTGGTLTSNVTAAAAERDTQARLMDAARQDLKMAVARAYVAVLRAGSALDVARSNAASLAAHVRDVEDMRRTGQVPANDYLAASVSLADAQQRELQTQGTLEVARAAYNRQLGRPLTATVDVEPLLDPLAISTTAAPLPDLVAAALASRPELSALDAAVDAFAARATAARGTRRPQLALNGGYAYLENQFMNREDFWFISLDVRISVFDGGRSRHTSAAFERQSDAAADDKRDHAAEIALEVHRAWAELSTANARVAVAAGAVEQADENLRVVRDRYRNGEGTNTEVLDAEALRAESASNYDAARYDARLAELTLARAVGAL